MVFKSHSKFCFAKQGADNIANYTKTISLVSSMEHTKQMQILCVSDLWDHGYETGLILTS